MDKISYNGKEWEYKFKHKNGDVYANNGDRIYVVDGIIKLKYKYSLM